MKLPGLWIGQFVLFAEKSAASCEIIVELTGKVWYTNNE